MDKPLHIAASELPTALCGHVLESLDEPDLDRLFCNKCVSEMLRLFNNLELQVADMGKRLNQIRKLSTPPSQ